MRLLFLAILSATLALAQQATLQGRVTDADNHPLRKVALTLRANGPGGTPPQPSYAATSDANGEFSFDAIEPGYYLLSAERAGYLTQAYRSSPRETNSRLTLTPGQRLRGIDLAMTRTVVISGTVLDADGDPVASIQVSLLRRTGLPDFGFSNARSAFTDAAGRYVMPDTAPGQYTLSARGGNLEGVFLIAGMRTANPSAESLLANPGRMPVYYTTTYYPGETDLNAASIIRVVAGQNDIDGVDIRLRPTPAFLVKGKIIGEVPGYPLAQCQVMLSSTDVPFSMGGLGGGLGYGGTSGAIAKDGTFEFHGMRFSPGNYVLTVVSQAKRTVLARQTVVVAGRDVDNLAFNLQPLVQLHGTLAIEGRPGVNFATYPGATPPPTVTVRVTLEYEGNRFATNLSSQIQSDGSFTIADIAPGTYRLWLSGGPFGTYVKSVSLASRNMPPDAIVVDRDTAGESLHVNVSEAMGRIAGVLVSDDNKAGERPDHDHERSVRARRSVHAERYQSGCGWSLHNPGTRAWHLPSLCFRGSGTRPTVRAGISETV